MKQLIIYIMVFFSLAYSKEIEELKIQLNSKNILKFAGIYIAKEKGYYKEVGIDVKLIDYKKDINIIDRILENKADIGFSDIELFYEYQKGKPLIFLSNFFKHSSSAIVTQKESVKNNFVYLPLTIENLVINKMAKELKLSLKNNSLIKDDELLGKFLEKEIFGIKISKLEELYLLNKSKHKYDLFDPTLYDIEYYEQNLFTNKNILIKKQIEIESFIEATIKGWKYILENEKECIDIIFNKYNKNAFNIEFIDFQLKEILKLIVANEYDIGSIDEYRVNEIFEEIVHEKKTRFNTMGDLKNFIHKNNKLKLEHFEKEYLHSKKELSVCIIDESKMNIYEKNNNMIGLEYINLISKRLDIPIKYIYSKNITESVKLLKDIKCDFIPTVSFYPKLFNKKEIIISKPYTSDNIVLIGKKDNLFELNFNIYNSKSIGILKSLDYYSVLIKEYPKVNFVLLDDVGDAVKRIRNGQILGFLDTYHHYIYNIKEKYQDYLSINSKLDEKVNLYFIFNEKVLKNIFNKIIEKIDSYVDFEIKNKLIPKMKNSVYIKIIYYVSIFLILIFILLFVNYLILRNKTIKIQKENEKQNKVLIHQTKMASLGEMINIIAHQWKQPLAELSFINIYLKEIVLDKKAKDKMQRVEYLIEHMSDTIETFQQFYREVENNDLFNLKKSIENAMLIFESNIKMYEIITKCKIDNKILVRGNKNEFVQVLLSIIQNIIYIIEKRQILNPKITIHAKRVKKNVVLIIYDNAGGVDIEPIDSIFDPFITTNPNHSSGIGLFMAKKIIIEKFKGEIKVKNYAHGTKFIIILR